MTFLLFGTDSPGAGPTGETDAQEAHYGGKATTI